MKGYRKLKISNRKRVQLHRIAKEREKSKLELQLINDPLKRCLRAEVSGLPITLEEFRHFYGLKEETVSSDKQEKKDE